MSLLPNLQSMEKALVNPEPDYLKAYKLFDDMDVCMTATPSLRSQEVVLKISKLVLDHLLESNISLEKKQHLGNRILMHLAFAAQENSHSEQLQSAIIVHLFRRALLEPLPFNQTDLFSLAIKVIRTSELAFSQLANAIRDLLAAITFEQYLGDIYGAGVNQDIHLKLRSGELERSLQMARELAPMLGSKRVAQLFETAKDAIKTLRDTLEADLAPKFSHLVSQISLEREQLEQMPTVPTTSLAEQLQQRHAQFIATFKEQFLLIRKKNDPDTVRDFQERMFKGFVLFLIPAYFLNRHFLPLNRYRPRKTIYCVPLDL